MTQASLNWPNILRGFRKKHNLTQQQFADLLPITSKRNIQDWEQGVHTPPPYLQRALRDLEGEIRTTSAYADGENYK